MSNRMYGRIRVSLESLVEEPAVAEEDVIEIATRPDPEAVEAVAEMNDAGEVVIDHETDVAELADATDNLEQYRAVLEGSLEENGMDAAGARAIQVGLDSTLSRVGTEINTPALESYGSASNRIQATRLTIEAIGDKVKEIWEAIKRALANAWAALKKFFLSVFSAVERTRQQAEKVKAAASAATGTPTETSVEVKGAGTKLAINGKVPTTWVKTVSNVLTSAAAAVQKADEISGLYSSVAQSMAGGSVTEGMASASGAVKSYMDEITSVAQMFAKDGGMPAASSFKVPGVDSARSSVQLSAFLPGNAVFYVASPKGSESGPMSLADTVAASKAGFYQMGAKGEASDTFTVLKDAEIVQLADAIIDACNQLDQRKDALAKTAEAGTALVKAGDSLLNKAANESDDVQAQVRQTVQALPRLAENSGQWPKQLVSYLVGVSGATLKVAQASLKAYRAAESGTAALAAPAATA